MRKISTVELRKILEEALGSFLEIGSTLDDLEKGTISPDIACESILDSIGFAFQMVSHGVSSALPLCQKENAVREFYTIGWSFSQNQIIVEHSCHEEEFNLINFDGHTSKQFVGLRKRDVAEKLLNFRDAFSRTKFSEYALSFLPTRELVRKNEHVVIHNNRVIAYLDNVLATRADIEELLSFGYTVVATEDWLKQNQEGDK